MGIAKKEMIPHEEANLKIASYVRFLYDGLHKGSVIELKNVGIFQLGDENSLQFEPSYHLNYFIFKRTLSDHFLNHF